MGLDPVVGHRQQLDAGLPAPAQDAGDLGQGLPAASSWVRTMWVAKSRSPRVNQAGPAPYAASSSLMLKDSSARPQPCSWLMPPPSVYITVSRSGQTRRPNRVMSSPVLPITVIWASGAAAKAPQEARGADAAGEHGNPHAASVQRPGGGG